MTIELELSPRVNEWHEQLQEGNTEDIWDSMDQDELKERSSQVTIGAVSKHLSEDDIPETVTRQEFAELLHISLTIEDERQLRRQVLRKSEASKEDYLDRLANEIINHHPFVQSK